ncbi:DUF2922 domain-containing protein [Caldicellulosiruptoraceae bacterium PP1]
MKTLVLTFRTQNGKSFRISIPEPKENITQNEINQAMTLIIQKNIFASSNGDIVAIDNARIVDRNVSELLTAN